MENYKYILKYECDGTELTYVFDADVTLDTLKSHLKYFLSGCSWSEDNLKFLSTEEE